MLLNPDNLTRPPSANASAQFATDAYVIYRHVLPPDRAGELRRKRSKSRAGTRAVSNSRPYTILALSRRHRRCDCDRVARAVRHAQSSELRDWVAAITGMPYDLFIFASAVLNQHQHHGRARRGVPLAHGCVGFRPPVNTCMIVAKKTGEACSSVHLARRRRSA